MQLCLAAATLTAQYNNLDSVRDVFAANKGEIAGVILEPVVGNSGYIAPTKEFLQVHCPPLFVLEARIVAVHLLCSSLCHITTCVGHFALLVSYSLSQNKLACCVAIVCLA